MFVSCPCPLQWPLTLTMLGWPTSLLSRAQFGVIGGCAFNLILAVHTFLLLVLKVRDYLTCRIRITETASWSVRQVKPPPYVRYLFICGGWFIAVFLTILGPATNRASFSFYGPTNGRSHFMANITVCCPADGFPLSWLLAHLRWDTLATMVLVSGLLLHPLTSDSG